MSPSGSGATGGSSFGSALVAFGVAEAKQASAAAAGGQIPEVPDVPDVPDVQVAPEHYDFENYDNLERWASYWYQIRGAMRLRPKRVLEIGTGSGVFRSYLAGAGIEVRAVDIDDTRKPDYVADVTRLDETLPPGERFDIVAAFQVLEHVPFDKLAGCLEGIAKRGRHALISLPCKGFQLRWSMGIGDLKLATGFYLPYPYPHGFNRQHYWELSRNYSIRRITRLMEQDFEVLKRFRLKQNPYHIMWELRSKRFDG